MHQNHLGELQKYTDIQPPHQKFTFQLAWDGVQALIDFKTLPGDCSVQVWANYLDLQREAQMDGE